MRDAGRTGVMLMLVGSVVLATADALTKLLTEALPVGQLVCLRSALMVGLILAYACRGGRRGPGMRRVLATRNRLGQALRAAFMVCSSLMFVAGLSFLPLPTASTVNAAGPLFTTALAPLLLGELVGWRRWAAVATGFSGVVLITWPTEGFVNWAILLPIGAALSGALRDLITRHMGGTESGESMMPWGTLALVVVCLFSLPFGWVVPDLVTVLVLVVLAFFHCAGQLLMVEAFRRAEAGLVVPFKYTMLVWAVVFGYVFWHHIPQWNVVAGAAVIVCATLYIFRREAAVRH